MSDISKNILDQIKEEGIKPRPRWQFVLISVALIIVLIATITTGGIAMSLILLKLFNLEWDLVSFTGDGGRPTILDVLPLVWIALLGLVLLLAVWAFEKTEAGYKYHPMWIVVGSIFISAILGGFLYGTRGADLFDKLLQENIPPYSELEKMRALRFHLPESGILPGRVVEIISPSTMQLEDLREQIWSVELAPPMMKVKNLENIPVNTMVMVVGEMRDNNNFLARDIRMKTFLMPPRLKEQLKDRLKKRLEGEEPFLKPMRENL